MRITGPAAGHDLLKTAGDPTGTSSMGAWNKCGNGRTPWGTYLACEENFNGYFSSSDPDLEVGAAFRRYGIGRIPFLLDIPCRIRFPSCEPLLGPVDLSGWIDDLHWVIAGGESGGGARLTQPGWIRGLRDQCIDAGVAFHFKQWGVWRPKETGGDWATTSFVRMTKKRAGRTLDGRRWKELPDD